MASNAGDSVKMKRVLECSVCLKTMTTPKCLPCVHTFCLHCLEGYGKDKVPESELQCPLCGQPFQIPCGGLEQLPNNYFIEQLQLLESASSKKSVASYEISSVCDACGEDEASQFCVDCSQDLCETCATIHGKIRATQLHTLWTREEKRNFSETVAHPNYCEQHVSSKLELYCNNCEIAICLVCFTSEHKGHVASCIAQVSDKFKVDIEYLSGGLDQFVEECKREIREIEIDTNEYKKQFSSNELAVKEKGEAVKRLVDSQVNQLLEQLNSLKTEKLKVFMTRKDQVERQLLILDSYQLYVDVLIQKGTPCDVIRNAKDLLNRATEIVTSQDELEHSKLNNKLGFQIVSFLDAELNNAQRESGNFIGTLSVQDNYIRTLLLFGLDTGPKVVQEICHISLSHKDATNIFSATPTLVDWGAAACTYVDSIFLVGVGKSHNELWRYSSQSQWKRLADLPGSGRSIHCVAVVDSSVYVLGRMDRRTTAPKVLSYNIDNNTWSTAGQLTHAVRNAACLAYKESIYVFGGKSRAKGHPVDHVQVYNTVSQMCTLGANPLPEAKSHLRAVLWETSAVLLGRDTCFIYGYETETWLERKQFKTDVMHFGLLLNNETLYIAGGSIYKVDRDKNTIWTCSDEIRCTSVLNIMQDKPAVWRHHAKLPRPALIHAYNTTPLRLRWQPDL